MIRPACELLQLAAWAWKYIYTLRNSFFLSLFFFFFLLELLALQSAPLWGQNHVKFYCKNFVPNTGLTAVLKRIYLPADTASRLKV